MKCPICDQEHNKDYLEVSDIRKHEKDDEYAEHYYIYVYCNYSDIGVSFYADPKEWEWQK